ncbi:MAG: carotenoid 1,2-hydratase [Limnobacter sp.]|uniref:lipocalin-like domain-containing protein n=1 Tax=Limnobacter sp. TaxID=2003368 RepID=UPI0022C67070|nr:lipocalin-like domain-containing protein [Limnobacter sp.]MCZ8015625.1 carotenoid 1,2-hydratase [Limnobacter sp.]
MKRRNILKAGLGLPVALPLSGWSGITRAAQPANSATRQYAQPTPEVLPALPRDHGPHLDFRTEWWYFTGWFDSPALNIPLGVQITFFRSAPNVSTDNPSAFAPTQLLFAHAAVALTDKDKLEHTQIIRRAGTGGSTIKGNAQEVLNIQMPGWKLNSAQGEAWECVIQTSQLFMNLRMEQTQTPWLQGRNGFSQKGPLSAQSSYYITLPHMKSSGTIRLDGKAIPVTGSFWMDHEWSSTVLAPNAQGWDWVGLHGDQGEALMAFQIRDRDRTKGAVWTHAAMRLADGTVREFKQVKFEVLRRWKSTRTGIEYPVEQQLVLDGQAFSLEPLFNDQELDARASTGTLYWEGAVRVKSVGGSPWGKGYLEMTGYDRPMQL